MVTKTAAGRKAVKRGGLPLHVDVLIVGAGLSGVGVASHLRMKQPGRTLAIIDGRDAIGGTWDLFRYPGLRSDSDLHTFGYEFKPWLSKNAIADGHEILSYIRETADEYGLGPSIHVGHKVVSASFSSDTGTWTVDLERRSDGQRLEITCDWLFSAAGYYDHAGGYTPELPGREDFAGQIVHPQDWPADLDYTGKKVIVIGSGATAVTLIPAMAERAGHITMLQRSPTYIVSLPKQDPVANLFSRLLPTAMAYRLTRAFNITRIRLIYGGSQRYPEQVRKLIRNATAKALPEGFDVDTHFKPTYNPWDQRLCTVPDGDLFKALSAGKASIVTDHIAKLTAKGILLRSGEELKADIIVTATGLRMIPFGGIELRVDGEQVDLHNRLIYKAMMLSGVPNFAFAIGYTNSSWTLKVDLVAEHLCRLLAHLDRQGQSIATPRDPADSSMTLRPMFDMGSGYISRAWGLFPQQGSKGPWTVPQSYSVDKKRLREGPVEDPALRLSTPRRHEVPVHLKAVSA